MRAGGFHKANLKLEKVTEAAHREAKQIVSAQTDAADAIKTLTAIDIPDLSHAVVSLSDAVRQLDVIDDTVRVVLPQVVGSTKLVASLGSPGRPILDLLYQVKNTLDSVSSSHAVALNHLRQAVAVLWDRKENAFSPFGGKHAQFDPNHSVEDRARRARDGVAFATIMLGHPPINSTYAGKVFFEDLPDELKQKFPEGVRFSYEAFPDFSPYAKATVVLINGFGPSREDDKAKAQEQWEAEHGISLDISDYTWHHCEDGRTLRLVDRSLHYQVKHTGGWPITDKLGTRRSKVLEV